MKRSVLGEKEKRRKQLVKCKSRPGQGNGAIGNPNMDENMQDAGGKLLGSDTTRLIRERVVAGGQRAIIAGNSTHSADEDKKKLKDSGQDWFWGKPPPSGGRWCRTWRGCGERGRWKGRRREKKKKMQSLCPFENF